MSEEKRNRKLVFITGLSLGLVLGGAVIFFSQNTQIIKYPIEVSQNTIKNIVNQVTGEITAKQDSINKANKKVYVKKSENALSTSTEKDSIQDVSNATDTLVNDTISNLDETIMVKKDELVMVKNIEALTISAIDNKNDKDSILQAASGIQIEKKNGKKVLINTEFWKSPINYRGYKFLKNKLVVFGIDPQDNISILIVDEIFYLKAINGVFKISSTEEFRSFERVNNSTIISLFD